MWFRYQYPAAHVLVFWELSCFSFTFKYSGIHIHVYSCVLSLYNAYISVELRPLFYVMRYSILLNFFLNINLDARSFVLCVCVDWWKRFENASGLYGKLFVSFQRNKYEESAFWKRCVSVWIMCSVNSVELQDFDPVYTEWIQNRSEIFTV